MKEFAKCSGSTAALKYGAIALLACALLPALSGCAGSQEAATTKQTTAQAEETSEFDMPSEDFIAKGMSTEELKSLVGEPAQKEPLEATGSEAWYYDFGVVIMKDGRVQYKHPPSKAAGKKPPS